MVYVFLADGFEEIEALTQIDYLRRAGIDTVSCGVAGLTVTGSRGIKVFADISINDADIENAEMIILPGGLLGVDGIKKSEKALSLIDAAFGKGIFVCAICAAPTILAERGYLKNKKCICYPDMTSVLSENGGIVTDAPVVCDGKIITAKAAGASEQFSFAIIEALKGKDAAEAVRKSICAR